MCTSMRRECICDSSPFFPAFCCSVCVCLCTCVLILIRPSVCLWTVAHQAPLSIGVFQARILEWVATSFSMGSSQLRGQTPFCIAGRFVTSCDTWEASIVIRTSNKCLDREPFNQLLSGSESSQKSNSTLAPKVQGKGRKTVSLDSIFPMDPFVTFLGQSASILSGK